MKLDVVVPSFNRSQLLRKTLESLLRATVPADLQVTIYVVDNNSKDDTASVVAEIAAASALQLRYLLETRQSSSFARNTGISAGAGDLIGFVDDDEQVDAGWFAAIEREFRDPDLMFIGGPYFGEPGVVLPRWLPPSYRAATGVQEPRARAVFGAGHAGNLNSGNAVIRRSVFEAIGLYSEKLGRSGKGLLSEEDADLYRRIQAAHFHGVFVPDLVIYHHVPAERLTKKYHRRWVFWRGVSLGLVDRTQREPTTYRFGVPQYKLGRAVRALPAVLRSLVRRGSDKTFDQELAAWDLAGFLYGKHFVKIEGYYK